MHTQRASIKNIFFQTVPQKRPAQVPAQTIVYYSRRAMYIALTFMLLVLSIALVSAVGMVYGPQKVTLLDISILSVVLATGVWGIYSSYTRAQDKNPQMILNARGIETSLYGFRSWEEITDEQVYTDGNQISYLTYDYQKQTETLSITDYNIRPRKLAMLLHAYKNGIPKADRSGVGR